MDGVANSKTPHQVKSARTRRRRVEYLSSVSMPISYIVVGIAERFCKKYALHISAISEPSPRILAHKLPSADSNNELPLGLYATNCPTTDTGFYKSSCRS